MIDRRYLRCIQCEQTVTVRTAIGHADYQEFAFRVRAAVWKSGTE
jgi:hypothetical protein